MQKGKKPMIEFYKCHNCFDIYDNSTSGIMVQWKNSHMQVSAWIWFCLFRICICNHCVYQIYKLRIMSQLRAPIDEYLKGSLGLSATTVGGLQGNFKGSNLIVI